MNLPYTYTVVSTDVSNGVMELRYESPGQSPVHVSARLPLLGESLDAVAASYAPIGVWASQNVSYAPPQVGATGGYTPPNMQPSTLSVAKAIKKQQIAQWRYATEVGGILVNGIGVKTDRESQAQLTAAYSTLRDGLIPSIDWKGDGGLFVTLDLQQVQALATAVAAHVQSSFTEEKNLCEQVDAATTVEQVAAIRSDLGDGTTLQVPAPVVVPVDRVVV